MKTKVIAWILVFVLMVSSIGIASARYYRGDQAPEEGERFTGPGRMSQLTEEQKPDDILNMYDYRHSWSYRYSIIRPGGSGPNFVDDDGDSICDNNKAYTRHIRPRVQASRFDRTANSIE